MSNPFSRHGIATNQVNGQASASTPTGSASWKPTHSQARESFLLFLTHQPIVNDYLRHHDAHHSGKMGLVSSKTLLARVKVEFDRWRQMHRVVSYPWSRMRFCLKSFDVGGGLRKYTAQATHAAVHAQTTLAQGTTKRGNSRPQGRPHPAAPSTMALVAVPVENMDRRKQRMVDYFKNHPMKKNCTVGGLKLSSVALTALVVGTTSTVTLKLHNGSDQNRYIRVAIVLHVSSNTYTVHTDRLLPCVLAPKEEMTLSVHVAGSVPGADKCLVCVDAKDFSLGRSVDFTVAANQQRIDEISDLLPREPYEPRRRRRPICGQIHPALPSSSQRRKSGIKSVHRMDEHKIPPWVRAQSDEDIMMPPPNAAMKEVAAHLQKLLWLEECQMEEDIEMYAMEGVKLDKRATLYRLIVPGLSEKRPSVLYGDTVLVQDAANGDGPWHRGVTQRVELDGVLLEFTTEFNRGFLPNKTYNVRFTFCRIPLMYMHMAVTRLAKMDQSESPVPMNRFLSPPPVKRSSREHKPYFNKHLNDRQQQAVTHIVSEDLSGWPYFVHGPPGTGKTTVLIEAILQIYSQPGSRILVCCPSNSACDLYLYPGRLHEKVAASDMLRLNALSRNKIEVDEKVLRCSLPDGDHFRIPPLEEITKYRIVICTCATAGQLLRGGLNLDHFTFVAVDEAGQAFEPEALIPLVAAAGKKTRVALAGDPKQLGPVVRSARALRGGLGDTLLDRVATHPAYVPNTAAHPPTSGYNPVLATKLVDNYRSHPRLLETPSTLFYGGELNACAGPKAHSFVGWSWLPNSNVPLAFVPVRGSEAREKGSPSWFNPEEVLVVADCVQKVLELKGKGITHKEIGVITPYRGQVRKIQKQLLRLKFKDVKVGSVEEFQGDERRVIILSTVRSCIEYIAEDTAHNIGFLNNPRRFNVAVTRPQALLIVVGNPTVLQHDPVWRQLLLFVANHKAYKSPSFFDFETFKQRARDEEAMREATDQLAVLSLSTNHASEAPPTHEHSWSEERG